MKTIDVRNLKDHLGSYLDQVAGGETLEIRRRKKAVARLVPYVAEAPAEPWPDLAARLYRAYPAVAVDSAALDILYKDRDSLWRSMSGN